MAEKKQIEKLTGADPTGRSKQTVLIALVLVLLAILAVIYALCGMTVALFTAGVMGFFAIFVFLPDLIATWRGTQLQFKSDLAGDEIGLPLVVLAFPYRLWQALTNAPTKEIRGWPALLGDNKEKTDSPLADRRARLRESLRLPLDQVQPAQGDAQLPASTDNNSRSEPSSLLEERIENLAAALSNQQRLAVSDAAQQLQVTTVTIRRYISEFGIESMLNANGIQLLPPSSVEELREIRRLKHSGMPNDKVLAILEEKRHEPLK